MTATTGLARNLTAAEARERAEPARRRVVRRPPGARRGRALREPDDGALPVRRRPDLPRARRRAARGRRRRHAARPRRATGCRSTSRRASTSPPSSRAAAPPPTGSGLVRSVDPADGAVYVYGQSFLDDAQRIFACFDQPDLKATFTMTRRRPRELGGARQHDGHQLGGRAARVRADRADAAVPLLPGRRPVARRDRPPRGPRPRRLVPRLARAVLRGRRDPRRHPAVPGLPAAALRPADAVRADLRPGLRPGLQRRARWRTPPW